MIIILEGIRIANAMKNDTNKLCVQDNASSNIFYGEMEQKQNCNLNGIQIFLGDERDSFDE